MTQTDNNTQINMVTVITVSYNAAHEIEKTIRSVIGQSYENIEYIVIDGNSSDETVDIIKKYADKISKWTSEPDNGIFDAMNKGLNLAVGNWVIFMNAGDYFTDTNVLEKVFNQEYNMHIGILYGKVYLDLITEGRLSNWVPFMHNSAKIKGMGISHQAIFVRTELAKKYKFNESFKIAADYNMINQIYRQGYLLYDLNFPIAIYDTFGYSSQNRVLQFKEIARICEADTTINFKSKLTYLKFKLFIKNYIKQRKK